ncbi:MAG: hypothetical protein ABI039_00345, partial [Vicinamibacterales bacterium]
MATVKRIADLTQYAGVLPYDSEIFGIYQPLLGWKSRRIAARFENGLKKDKAQLIRNLERQISPSLKIEYDDAGQIHIDIATGELHNGAKRSVDSVVLENIGQSLPPYVDYDQSIWGGKITKDILDTVLKRDVVGNYTKVFSQLRDMNSARLRSDARSALIPSGSSEAGLASFEKYLAYESQVAGMLLLLVKERDYDALKDLFYVAKDGVQHAGVLSRVLSGDGPTAHFDLDHLDPTDAKQLDGVALSPISVVHLFRQYFFELDTFLGTSQQHVWLSPGSSVELLEVHTRRTTIEKTIESTLDVLTKSESTTTTRDEISEAVRDENNRDIKAGASVKATYTSVQATASFDYASSQKQARETSHKRAREQTDKLSSEIRKNFKTTFKSTTETTDSSSTRHLLANNTNELINYEMRRKMRQVGVQVQDIGTYLCWQTYVDDPGASLGLAKLVHIAKPAELDAIPHPQELPTLQPFQENKLITIPFISIDGTDADSEGEVYVNGIESDNSEFLGSEEHIQSRFHQEFVCPRVDYELTDVEYDSQGKPVTVSRASAIDNGALPKASFMLNLDSADFGGQNSVQVNLILHWSPLASANQDIQAKNQVLQDKFNADEKAAFEKAAIETLKDRVDVISKLGARSSEELRDEERIVIYRELVQGMLQNHIAMPDDRTRHVVAELINSIFDVDKMLYFVSPEWWRPRLHRSSQQLKVTPDRPAHPPMITGTRALDLALNSGVLNATMTASTNSAPTLAASSTVGWGGIDDVSRDNYYITSDSDPAKMGSSLGWLLQLDGDNMRNAFLNAPWVKAVMPIRPGKEQ